MVIDPKSDGSGFDAKEWPFFWLTHATGLYLHRLDNSLKRVGLDVPRWRVLMCVRPGDARSVSEIAELAIVKLPTMMKLIQRMEGEGVRLGPLATGSCRLFIRHPGLDPGSRLMPKTGRRPKSGIPGQARDDGSVGIRSEAASHRHSRESGDPERA